MKKVALTIAIILGMAIGAHAQNAYGGGMFGYGQTRESNDWGSTNWSTTNEWLRSGGALILPAGHGLINDYAAPLGSGALVLIGFGAAYAMKRKNQK